MDRQELIDEAIKVTKDTIMFCDDWTALDKLMAFVPTERLKEFLPVEEQDQTIEQLEAALEATRQKIAEQLSLVGKSIQSIDPTLYDKERILEQAVIDGYLDEPAKDYMHAKARLNATLQDLLTEYKD
jgi:hypothetical protein